MIARIAIALAILLGLRGPASAGESTAPIMSEARDDLPRAPLITPMPAQMVGSEARAGRVTVIAQPGLEDQGLRSSRAAPRPRSPTSRRI